MPSTNPDNVVSRVITAHPFLQGLEGDSLGRITVGAHRLCVESGEYILRLDDQADSLFLIWAGEVDLGFAGPNGGFHRLETLEAWDVVGWSWALEPFQWELDARAATRVEAIALNARQLRAEMNANSGLHLELMKRLLPVIAARVRFLRNQLLTLQSAS